MWLLVWNLLIVIEAWKATQCAYIYIYFFFWSEIEGYNITVHFNSSQKQKSKVICPIWKTSNNMQFKAMCLVCKIVSLLLLSHSSSGCSDPLTNTQLCTSSYIISGVHKFCFHIRPTVLNLIKKKRVQVIEMPCYYGYCICSVSTTHCEFRTPESHTKNQKK